MSPTWPQSMYKGWALHLSQICHYPFLIYCYPGQSWLCYGNNQPENLNTPKKQSRNTLHHEKTELLLITVPPRPWSAYASLIPEMRDGGTWWTTHWLFYLPLGRETLASWVQASHVLRLLERDTIHYSCRERHSFWKVGWWGLSFSFQLSKLRWCKHRAIRTCVLLPLISWRNPCAEWGKTKRKSWEMMFRGASEVSYTPGLSCCIR